MADSTYPTWMGPSTFSMCTEWDMVCAVDPLDLFEIIAVGAQIHSSYCCADLTNLGTRLADWSIAYAND